MKRLFSKKFFLVLGWVSLLGVIFFGILRAYTKEGHDFSVFYEAWRLVLAGRGTEIYRVSPDRFLYSPSFAWLLSPMAFLPKNTALGFWCALKVAVLGFMIHRLSGTSDRKKLFLSWGVSVWGVVLIARPVLIDFEYGQVNLFIVAACLWGLTGHFEKTNSAFWEILRWGILTFVAVVKLFPLPLLIVPWVVTEGIDPKKLKLERQATFLGLAVALFLPLLSLGLEPTGKLFLDWREALLARGLPMESHNQSFTALLYHYLSGRPTSVLSEGSHPLVFGQAWLSEFQIVLLSLFWTITLMGLILAWVILGSRRRYKVWIAVLIALLIVPSHLIWKPYFVMSLPLAVLLVRQHVDHPRWVSLGILISIFFGINLTGFDFVGHHWAAHLEAASLLLMIHLAMILFGIFCF